MGQRRRGREYAVQVLFQIDLTGDTPDGVLQGFWSGLDADAEVRLFTERLVRGVSDERDALDRRIVEAASNWRPSSDSVLELPAFAQKIDAATTRSAAFVAPRPLSGICFILSPYNRAASQHARAHQSD